MGISGGGGMSPLPPYPTPLTVGPGNGFRMAANVVLVVVVEARAPPPDRRLLAYAKSRSRVASVMIIPYAGGGVFSIPLYSEISTSRVRGTTVFAAGSLCIEKTAADLRRYCTIATGRTNCPTSARTMGSYCCCCAAVTISERQSAATSETVKRGRPQVTTVERVRTRYGP